MYVAKSQGEGYQVFAGADDTHAKQTPPARPDHGNAG
jgi:hypothetical protein